MSVFLFVNGQNKTKFNYDASGNRVERIIDLTKSATTSTQEVLIEQINDYKIKIYPNPTKGQLKIEMLNSDDIKSFTISIYTLGGKLITTKKGTIPITEIDLSNRQNGIYIMNVEVNGKTSPWKILKN